MGKRNLLSLAIGALALSFAGQSAWAGCRDVDYASLQAIANDVVDGNESKSAETGGGFNLPMWVTIVDESGKVCHVVNTNPSGKDKKGRSNESWLGSRIISAQKANTANAFSVDGFSISTANLYGLALPGGSLYGLQHSNPVDTGKAYRGSPNAYGTKGDPIKNKRIGGVNVFGGGLALYNASGAKVGAIGVSGDTSCTDHTVAWRIRKLLELDNVPGGFITGDGMKGDELFMDADGNMANTVQQPTCANPPAAGADNGVIVEEDIL